MKKISAYFALAVFVPGLILSKFIPVALATNGGGILGGDGTGGGVGTTMNTTITFVQSTLIPFILGIGFLVFVFGMFQYFIVGGANDEARAKGKQLVIYSVAGFVLILAFWGIVNIIASGVGTDSTGVNAPQINITNSSSEYYGHR